MLACYIRNATPPQNDADIPPEWIAPVSDAHLPRGPASPHLHITQAWIKRALPSKPNYRLMPFNHLGGLPRPTSMKSQGQCAGLDQASPPLLTPLAIAAHPPLAFPGIGSAPKRSLRVSTLRG